MASSFLIGYNKVLEAKEPRFLVLTGDEYALQEKILNVVRNRPGANILYPYDFADVEPALFTQNTRTGQSKTIVLREPGRITSWDWLPVWFNTVKNARIIVADTSPELAERLSSRANTRGYCIDCSSPRGDTAKGRLAKQLAAWYDLSVSQVNHLLYKNNWQMTECLELLDKLAMLNLPLNSDTIVKLGVVHDTSVEFVEALRSDKPALAMTLISYLNRSDYRRILAMVSSWLDTVSRVKVAQSFMKAVHDLAFEVGESGPETEKLIREGRKFDVNRLNRLALTLAAADEQVAKGYHDGVLEVLVSTWQ